MSISKNIIVDLDGTLALERHRRPRTKKSWEEYFEHIHLDTVNDSVREMLEMFDATHRILIFTSRPIMYIYQTVDWLRMQGVAYDVLEMRSEEDTHLGTNGWQSKKSDADVKANMIAHYRLTPNNTLCVLEDRDEMCAFYRALGYDCWQVHPQHEMYTPVVGIDEANNCDHDWSGGGRSVGYYECSKCGKTHPYHTDDDAGFEAYLPNN